MFLENVFYWIGLFTSLFGGIGISVFIIYWTLVNIENIFIRRFRASGTRGYNIVDDGGDKLHIQFLTIGHGLFNGTTHFGFVRLSQNHRSQGSADSLGVEAKKCL